MNNMIQGCTVARLTPTFALKISVQRLAVAHAAFSGALMLLPATARAAEALDPAQLAPMVITGVAHQ